MARKKHPWAEQIGWAHAICAPFGCTVEISTAQYEIATVKGDGVSLIIYPHRTSASNYHARVRNNGSKDKAKADRVMRAMDTGEGLPEDMRWKVQYTCTFSVKNRSYSPVAREQTTLIKALFK